MEFTKEEIGLIEKLGLKVKKPNEPAAVLPTEVRAIFGVITCDLCKTVTKQFVRMEKWSDGIWRSGADYTEEEVDKLNKNDLEVYRERVKSCWNCKNVLMQKEKGELVEMIVKIYAPIPTKHEIWKYVTDLRKEAIVEEVAERKKKKKVKMPNPADYNKLIDTLDKIYTLSSGDPRHAKPEIMLAIIHDLAERTLEEEGT